MDQNIQRSITTSTVSQNITRKRIEYKKTTFGDTVTATSIFTSKPVYPTKPVPPIKNKNSTTSSSNTITTNDRSNSDGLLIELPENSQSPELTGSGQIIEPIDMYLSYTAEELDEKRENEKVYEYLHRLTEVRNWLKECLDTNDIAKETELEQNLSNGVLLAKLAHSFAPDVVPLSKIFDIDQSRFMKEGQPCYRHIDNICLWKDATRSVHFPEILIPDTVDIYEGRNIKTIFSLFALAKHLRRMRRGPPIRREDNLQYSPTILEDARERLKNSDFSLFGNIDEILATTPGDLDAHMRALSLLKYLKNADTGILYVNDALIDQYQNGLLCKTQNLKKNEFLNREQIQTVITEINDAEALKQLEYVLRGREKPEVSELNVILDDLQQEDILRNAGTLYAEELYKIRRTQDSPLTLEQVESVLKVVNMCMRVRFYVFENDERGVNDALRSKALFMETIMRPELKGAYKKAILKEYEKVGKDSVLMREQLQEIVEKVNMQNTNYGDQMQAIVIACQNEDSVGLLEALKGLNDFKKEFITFYMMAFQKNISMVSTMEEVNEIIKAVNRTVISAEKYLKDTLYLNMLLLEGKKDNAAELLVRSWENVIQIELLDEYIANLIEEMIVRKKRWENEENAGNDGYLPEKFSDGIIYINIENGQIKYQKPEKIVEWMLTRQEIENTIKMLNDQHGAEYLSNDDSAHKIQRWWRERLYQKDLSELTTSEKPRLRVVRRFIPILLQTKRDRKEDSELQNHRAYAIELINANQQLQEQLMKLDDKFSKLSNDRNSFTEKLSDFFRKSVLPIYSYGISNREMSLMALLLKNYLIGEINKIENPANLRNTQSYVILRLLMKLYGRTESQQQRGIMELNKKLGQKKYQIEHFNLDPIGIFESVTGCKPENVDEATANAVVAKVLRESKQFLINWANDYSAVIFGDNSEYPDIIRYIAISTKAILKERFPDASDDVLMQAVGAWLFKGCWANEITDDAINKDQGSESVIGLAARKVISKFIEYGILHYGYGLERYWMNSLNESIGQINILAKQHFTKCTMQNAPQFVYSFEDEFQDIYGSHRPVLHITMPQLQFTYQMLQNNINEVILNKNSRLYRLVADTFPPDNQVPYVTLYLRPFAADEIDNEEDLFQRIVRYVEQCLFSGCPGQTLSQILTQQTVQKEEDNFQNLPRRSDDQSTLDDTKRYISKHISILENTGRVMSTNDYQDIINAIAKDINQEHSYRKCRKAQLTIMHELVSELKKAQSKLHKQLEIYDDQLKNTESREEKIPDEDADEKTKLIQKQSIQKIKNSVEELIENGIVIAVNGYSDLAKCGDITLEISTTARPDILLFAIWEPQKQARYQAELSWQQLSGTAATIQIANKITFDAQKLMQHLSQSICNAKKG